MQNHSDAQLLRQYAAQHSEAAFSEIVARHAGLVYSAALRQLDSADLARDVAQSVFTDLARKARPLADKLPGDASLAGWLYRSTRFAARDRWRGDRRRQARERQVMEHFDVIAETAPEWEQVRPILDEAMAELSDEDREAVLLRYFEEQDLHAVGTALGVSDDAAQKRVSRALERLRTGLTSRGVTTTAGALSALLVAETVSFAPAGMAATLSTAALAGTTLATAATATATKAIAMTTLQKTLIAATLAAAVGTGIYEARQAAQLREQNQTLQEQQAPLTAQIRQLQRERDEAANRLAVVNEENVRLKSDQNSAELLKLRGEVGRLREQLALIEAQTGSPAIGFSKMLSDPAMREYIHKTQLNRIKANFGPLFKELKLTPEQTEQVVQRLGDLFMKNTDKMYALPQGTLSPAEIAQASVEREAELERQLQPLLGETGCARMKEFREEFPVHATLELLNGQLGANQLSDEQSTRLFQIVKAEPFDLTRGVAGDWDVAFWGSQEDIDKHLLKVAESNQRILQQASSFLMPEQLTALNTVLTNGVNERIAQAAALIQKH